jgi:hypothetical protein
MLTTRPPKPLLQRYSPSSPHFTLRSPSIQCNYQSDLTEGIFKTNSCVGVAGVHLSCVTRGYLGPQVYWLSEVIFFFSKTFQYGFSLNYLCLIFNYHASTPGYASPHHMQSLVLLHIVGHANPIKISRLHNSCHDLLVRIRSLDLESTNDTDDDGVMQKGVS